METRASYVIVGAVVLSAIAAALGFVLWLSDSQREFDQYDIRFTERVSGLLVGAQVRFNGIQKGEVESLTIDPEDPSIVIARIRVDKDTPVRTDTVAELEPVGFTGINIIQLVGGSPDTPFLKDASDDRIPDIKAKPGAFNQLFEGSGQLIGRAQQLISDENIESFEGILSNVETLTGTFANNEAEIDLLIKNASTITNDLAAVTAKLDAAATSMQRLMDEDAAASFEELEALLGQSNALVADLRAITGENRASLKVFADQGLGQVAPALAEARRLMRTFDYMLREIDRDPQGYFLGEQAPEYGVKEEEK